MKDYICQKCGKHYTIDELFWEEAEPKEKLIPTMFGLTHHKQGYFLCCGLKQIVAGKGDLPGGTTENPNEGA